MKIYRIDQGAVLCVNEQYYETHLDWDELIIQNDISAFLEPYLKLANKTQLSTHTILKPIGDKQELWACGVTYLNSKLGRQEESKNSGNSDIYEKVYFADRPEIFFKANPSRIVGTNESVRIRQDSTWNVPEPELTLVVSPDMQITAYTIGNDMSSRSLEGENPLYLPQAKTYDQCAALGPCLSLVNPFANRDTSIHLSIKRDNHLVFAESTQLSQMKRNIEDLVAYVFKECGFPNGCFIMTGTGIVPSIEFTLLPSDIIDITIDGIGTLTNTVQTNSK